jgi:hypothetical protein
MQGIDAFCYIFPTEFFKVMFAPVGNSSALAHRRCQIGSAKSHSPNCRTERLARRRNRPALMREAADVDHGAR